MTKLTRGLIGAGAGFVAGCAVAGARLVCAATAPISYPVISTAASVSAVVGGVVYAASQDILEVDNPKHMVVAGAIISMSAPLGFAWGVACIPAAVVEPVLAPLTAIPSLTVTGAYLATE